MENQSGSCNTCCSLESGIQNYFLLSRFIRVCFLDSVRGELCQCFLFASCLFCALIERHMHFFNIDVWRSVSCYGRILSYFKLLTVCFPFWKPIWLISLHCIKTLLNRSLFTGFLVLLFGPFHSTGPLKLRDCLLNSVFIRLILFIRPFLLDS